jgi:hypothetical protein
MTRLVSKHSSGNGRIRIVLGITRVHALSEWHPQASGSQASDIIMDTGMRVKSSRKRAASRVLTSEKADSWSGQNESLS